MFSVETEDEAKLLLTLACQRDLSNRFIARELVQEQTLENLGAFSDHLHQLYWKYIRKEPDPELETRNS